MASLILCLCSNDFGPRSALGFFLTFEAGLGVGVRRLGVDGFGRVFGIRGFSSCLFCFLISLCNSRFFKKIQKTDSKMNPLLQWLDCEPIELACSFGISPQPPVVSLPQSSQNESLQSFLNTTAFLKQTE